MNRTDFHDLFGHMEWADELVWDEVVRTPAIAADPFVRESLFHIHLVQFAYFSGWTGGTPDPEKKDDFASIEELRAWGRSYYTAVKEWLAALPEEELGRRDPVLWADVIEQMIGQPPVRISLADMMVQVATHTTQHRAQINRRIRELGGEPPFIDFVAWAWLGKP
ncbi:MAG: DinB family protein [Gemmatimonadota bacterium]